MVRILKWFRRKKNTNEHFVQDVLPQSQRRYLDLSHHARLIEFHSEIFRAFVRAHHKQLALIGATFLGLAILINAPQSGASLATFTPTTCLGGWQNPKNATGLPVVPEGSAPEKYTVGNSAVLKDAYSPIFCGDFAGSIPKDSIPRTFTLSFNWSVDDGSVVHEVPEPIDEGGSISIPEETVSEEVAPEESISEESVPAEVSPANEEPAPELEVIEGAPEEESASIIRAFAKLFRPRDVLAQEDAPAPTPEPVSEPVQSPAPEPTPAPEPERTPTPEPTTTPEPAPTAEDVVLTDDAVSTEETVVSEEGENASDAGGAVAPAPDSTFGDFMMVRYTLNGNDWRDLGTVSMSNWSSARFSISDAELGTWDDVSRLQIALEPIQTFDKMPVVYLDAMRIDVGFEDAPEAELPPTIELNDPDLTIISTEKDIFASAEEPTFDVTNPNLSVYDIAELVDAKKATVIEDKAGIYGAPTQEHTDTKDSPEQEQQDSSLFDKLKDVISDTIPSANVANAQSEADVAPAIDIEILDALGEEVSINASVERVVVDGETRNRITIEKPGRRFRPGKFSLKVTLHTPEALLVSRQDFSWGVLAVNTNKSIYAPEDEAYIQMGVLDDYGHTICDAVLVMRIDGPSGAPIFKRTSDGSIVQDPECGPDNVISVPDYHSRVALPDTPGVYTIRLAATTVNGTRTLVDSFEVRTSHPFVVSRTGPTRIFPVAVYPVSMTISSPTDWEGTVIERVPASFIISDHPDFPAPVSNIVSGDIRILTWNVSLTGGSSRTIGYRFDAPDISPEFYVLGPVSLYPGSSSASSGVAIFEEARQWQIASDAICSSQVSSGVWSDAGTWNCGRVPNSGDSAIISAGHTISLDMDATGANALLGLTINGTLDASALSCATGSRSCNITAPTLTIGATGTYLAGTDSTITLTTAGAVPFTLTSGGVFTAGTSTVVMTGGAGISINSGAITGSNAFYNLTINGGGTKNMTAAIDITNDLNVMLGVLDTNNTSNWPLSAGRIIIANIGTASISARASTITLTATSGTLFTRAASGGFTAGTSTIRVVSDADITFLNGATIFRNVTFAPVLTANRTYTLGSSPTISSGILLVSPSGTGTLTAELNGAVNLGASGYLQVEGTGSALGQFSTSSSNHSFTAGGFIVNTGGEFLANASTITLTANSGTHMTHLGTGVFTAGTSTVLITSTLAVTLSTGAFNGTSALYNLTIQGSSTKTLGADIDVSNITTITSGTIDTNISSNYTLSTGYLVMANSGSAVFTTRASTIRLTGTSGTLFTKGASSNLNNSGASTFLVTSDADITFLSGNTTFRNVTFAPVLTANRVYTIGSTPALSTGTFTINPSGTGTLTVPLNASTTFGATGNLVVGGSGGATGIFDTTPSNYATSVGTLTINDGGQFIANGSTVTLSATAGTNLTRNGSGVFSGGTSTILISSTLATNLNAGSFTGTNALYNLTLNGTGIKTMQADLEVMNAITITVGVLDLNSVGNYTVTTGSLSLANSGSAGINARAGTIILNANSGTLFTRGVSGLFNVNTSEFIVRSTSGTPSLISSAVSFHKLTIDSTATVINAGAAITIANAAGAQLYIKQGVLNDGGLGILLAGTTLNSMQIDAGGTLCLGGTVSASNTSATCNSGTTSTTVRGLPLFPTITLDPASTIIFLSDAAHTATHVPSTVTYGNVVISPTLTANRAFTFATGTTTIAGNLAIMPTGTASTLTVNMAGPLSVAGVTTIQRLGSNSSATLSTNTSNALSTGSLVVGGGACTGSSCTFTAGSSNISLTGTSGTLFTLGTGGIFTAGASTVFLSGNGNANINSGTIAFNALTQTGTGTKTLTGPISIASTRALTISAGTFDPASHLVTGSGSNTLSVANGATIRVGASTFAGNYSAGFSTITLSSGSTVDYNLAGTQTIDQGLSYSNLTTSGVSGVKTLGGNTTAGGTVSLDGGATLDTGSNYSLDADGIVFNGGTLAGNASLITVSGTSGTPIVYTSGSLTGTSTITLTGNNGSGNTTIPAGLSYHNLRVNNGSETYVSTGTLSVAGTLTAMAGTLDLDTFNTTAGNIDIDSGATLLGGSGTATLSGSWNNDGTFTAETSTISFTGAGTATISGSTDFYNLNISHTAAKEVNFSVSGSPIFGVTNHFNATGIGGGLVKLYSTASGTQWKFNPTGTSYVRYVDVKDGGCEMGANMMTVIGSTDSGNNDSCWAFSTISFSLSTAVSDATIGFGALSSTAPKFCTADEAGSYTEVEAHSIAITAESAGGYMLTVQGSPLSNGSHTLAPMGSSNIASIPGTEQFGLRSVATGGSGVVEALYSGSGFGFPASASTIPSVVAQSTVGDGVTTTYSMRYIANISSTTPPGAYSTNLTYIVTGTF